MSHKSLLCLCLIPWLLFHASVGHSRPSMGSSILPSWTFIQHSGWDQTGEVRLRWVNGPFTDWKVTLVILYLGHYIENTTSPFGEWSLWEQIRVCWTWTPARKQKGFNPLEVNISRKPLLLLYQPTQLCIPEVLITPRPKNIHPHQRWLRYLSSLARSWWPNNCFA